MIPRRAHTGATEHPIGTIPDCPGCADWRARRAARHQPLDRYGRATVVRIAMAGLAATTATAWWWGRIGA